MTTRDLHRRLDRLGTKPAADGLGSRRDAARLAVVEREVAELLRRPTAGRAGPELVARLGRVGALDKEAAGLRRRLCPPDPGAAERRRIEAAGLAAVPSDELAAIYEARRRRPTGRPSPRDRLRAAAIAAADLPELARL